MPFFFATTGCSGGHGSAPCAVLWCVIFPRRSHHIIPIAIVVTMLVMQRMTPQAGMTRHSKNDEHHDAGMFGVMSWNMAAGVDCTGPRAS